MYWASRTLWIRAHVDKSHRARVIASGDFSGAGAAVLRGALARLCHLPDPVTLDASRVTALSPDGARTRIEQATNQAKPMELEGIALAPRPLGPDSERGRSRG
jgi:hypothetical protein